MSQTLKIIMVDDEPDLCKGVLRALEGFRMEIPEIGARISFELAAVESAEKYFELTKNVTPDLVFLDYQLPGMTGLDVLERMAGRENTPLVVMITAFASLETAIRATRLGAFDFLAKPFSPEELRCALRKAATQLCLARRARSLEQEKRQVRFEFLSVLAHELKAPLNAVDGYLELLRDRVAAEDAFMVDRSRARIDGMRKLIFDLLDLTRIESGTRTRALVPTDIVPILRQAIDMFSIAAKERQISLRLEGQPKVTLLADAGEIEIIANNLISNAIKYNQPAGEVVISASEETDTVRIEVADTGIGISPEEMETIFQEFARIKNEQTRHISGSGLGLSTVKKLALLYGGDVTARSTPGKGSTFTVRLKSGGPLPSHPSGKE